MTEGISALGGTSELSLINTVFDNSKEKDDEKSGDTFDLLFQAIDDSIAQNQEQNNAENSIKESQKSDFNFGPPANIKIENLTYDTETSTKQVSLTETLEQPSGKPSGSSSKNSDDEDDETYSSMDLNQDGTVTTEEMLSYYGASESYGSSNTKASNDMFEQLLDLII